jgi:hypothetical protein
MPEQVVKEPDMDGWISLLITALGTVLGAGGVFTYIFLPIANRIRLRKIAGTGLWLSCVELRRHFQEIDKKVNEDNDANTKDALLKIPKNDYGGQARWFVQAGYFTMITSYKIAAFSAWMRIYKQDVLRAVIAGKPNLFIIKLFKEHDNFKVSVSNGESILWPDYLDALGDKIIIHQNDTKYPMPFYEFCKTYFYDREFMEFFDQLHIFIHFIGRDEDKWKQEYRHRIPAAIHELMKIERHIKSESLLRNFETQVGTTALSEGIWDEIKGKGL